MLESEKRTESYLVRLVKKYDGLCLKFTPTGFSGAPDRLCIFKNRIFFVETKSEGKDLRPRQRFVKTLLESFGLTVYKADTKKEVDEIFTKELPRIRNAAND